MTIRVWLLATMLIAAGVADSATYYLAEKWIDPEFEKREVAKLLAVGITDDEEVRHRFEDKLVSHLRGRGLEGETSYSMVPELQHVDNRQELLTHILDERIDAVISVRVVALKGKTAEAEWSAAWKAELAEQRTLRQLIEETLPIERSKAKKYGAEIAVWGLSERRCVWAGRTETMTRKQLQEGAGTIVQHAMDALKQAALF
ncbi:MAG: hypothetical protein GY716_10010 [bacterium]|nr:hypothetical protein [bacterium]